jgi:hypothetical protein
MCREGRGERTLLAAIVRRAAFDIALYRNDTRLVNRRLAVSAFNWMFRETDVGLPNIDRYTSFLNICEVLDQDPGRIRERTLQLKKTDVKRFDRVVL